VGIGLYVEDGEVISCNTSSVRNPVCKACIERNAAAGKAAPCTEEGKKQRLPRNCPQGQAKAGERE